MHYLDQTPTVNQRCNCISILFLFLWVLSFNTQAMAQGFGAPYKISGDLTGNEDVQNYQVSPNSAYVVYRADQDTNGVSEIYSVPSTGGTSVKLNSTLTGGGDVSSYQISPDSDYVVYLADQDMLGVTEMYSVPITGNSAPEKLNDTLVSGGNVSSYKISPDSNYVVYRADQDIDGVSELYSVPITGVSASAPEKLNGTLTFGGSLLDFQISADSNYVVYRANQDTLGAFEIYRVPIAGASTSSPQKLNGMLISGGGVQSYFQISPDGVYVVYNADQDTDNVFEIYSVPLLGGTTPVKLNATLISGGEVNNVFQISPDGATVVYQADQNAAGVNEIFSVPITGGATPVKLNGPLTSGGNVLEYQISPDGAYVVYRADQDMVLVGEIYSVPLLGGTTPVKLNGALPNGGEVLSEFKISSDGAYVVYRANQDTISAFEIFSATINGGTSPVKLNSLLTGGGNVFEYQISPDSAYVVYLADQDVDFVAEIYSAPITNGTAAVKLNGALAFGGEVSIDYQISPDGTTVVYRADQDTNNVSELFAVRIADTSVTEGDFCLPIKASNNNIAVICL